MVTCNCAADEIFDLDIITSFAVVPVGANNLVLSLDEPLQIVFICKTVEVFEDFFRRRVNGRPVQLWLKAPGVVV